MLLDFKQNQFSFYAQATSPAANFSFMNFHEVFINDGNGFRNISLFNNSSVSTFKCPSSGIYWFIYAACWDGTTNTTLILIGADRYPTPRVTRTHQESGNVDTLSGNSILELTVGQQLKLFSMYKMNLIEGHGGSSWGAFRLDSLMSHIIAFDVTLLQSSDMSLKMFEHIANVNAGENWSSEKKLFNATKAGVYYFSASIGIKSSIQAYFAHNGISKCAFMVINNVKHGTDTASRGCMLNLEVHDHVSLHFFPFSNIIHNFGTTTFRGFFYNPINEEAAVAWSVHYNSDISMTWKNYLKFDEILVDTHKSWSKTSGEFVVPISGKYLLEIVGTSSNKTNMWNPEIHLIDMSISVNKTDTLFLIRLTSNVRCVTRSRSAIIKLKKQDRLSVVPLHSNGSRTSGTHWQNASFQGFLLYPD